MSDTPAASPDEPAGAPAPAPASAVGAAASPSAAERPPFSLGRRLGVLALVAVGTLCLIVSALAFWIKLEVLDQGQFKQTSSALIADPVIRGAVADYAVNEVYSNVDVPGLLQQQLPQNLKPLAYPASAALRNYAGSTANKVLAQPRVQQLWIDASATAQQQLAAVLQGQKIGNTSTSGGNVVLDLKTVIEQIAGQLGIGQSLASQLPPSLGSVQIYHSDQLSQAQNAVSVLDATSYWGWFVALGFFAAAVWAAAGRRLFALACCSLGFLIAALVGVIVRRVLGDYVINSLVQYDSLKPAFHNVWWIVTERLAVVNLSLLIIGTAGLIGALYASRGPRRLALRGFVAPFIEDPTIAWSAFVGFWIVMLLWAPTPAFRTTTTLVILLALSILGFVMLRRQAVQEFPGAVRVPFTELTAAFAGRAGSAVAGGARSLSESAKPALGSAKGHASALAGATAAKAKEVGSTPTAKGAEPEPEARTEPAPDAPSEEA